jgi:N-acetylglutamate synthase-like GNAT family acetyltransferase
MSEVNLLARLRLDAVDLGQSLVVIANDAVVGVALVARRGWSSRVAAMGVASDWRGKGVGRFLMDELLRDARQRGDRQMVLEVIVQNQTAVRLYESVGFMRVRRLVGLVNDRPGALASLEPEEFDIRDLGRMIAVSGLSDLPWQLSAETIAHYTPPFRAYRLDGASALISDPGEKDVRFHALLVEPGLRHAGRAARLVCAIMMHHPERIWHVPAVFPEEIIGPLEAAGFRREVLAQWQMRLDFAD